MSAGHTPGPWRVNRWSRFESEVRATVDGQSVHVCGFSVHEDALLIAAAPDMLEALREFVGAVTAGTTFADQSVVDAARAAIAKALGQEGGAL